MKKSNIHREQIRLARCNVRAYTHLRACTRRRGGIRSGTRALNCACAQPMSDDELALDEMQSFACDLNLSDDGEGEALDWPQHVREASGDDDDTDSGCGQDVPQTRAARQDEDEFGSGDGVPRALQPGVSMSSRLDAMMSTEYWRSLCPQLHVSDPEFARKTARAVFNYVDDPDTVDGLRASMKRDGYVTMPAGKPGICQYIFCILVLL
eukprot:COSAG02_NODE_14296_length_1288_cov_1.210261_1_plen_209_part_00